MAAKKKTQAIGTVTPPVSIEFDWGTTGQRRAKRFDDAHEAKTFYTAKDKAGKNPKVVAADGKLTTDQTPPPEPPKTVKEDTAKAVLPPTKKTAPGVRAMRSRPYFAGVIVAKYGLEAGVTDEMVAELDAAYGKPNPTESRYRLKDAWHAARGYMGIHAEEVK